MGRAVTWIVTTVDRAISVVISILYTVIIGAMFAQVFFRYVVGSPLSWSEEISRYMFIWLVYLGAYVAVIRNAHVGVDYLTRRFSSTVLRRINVLLTTVIICALVFVAYHGIKLTRDNLAAEWWTIPFLSMGVPYAAVPVGAGLMILAFLRVMARQIAGQPAPAGASEAPVL